MTKKSLNRIIQENKNKNKNMLKINIQYSKENIYLRYLEDIKK
jgi:hypothetical protein